MNCRLTNAIRIGCIILISIYAYTSFGQQTLKFGLRVGGTLASQNISYEGISGILPDIKSKLGYDVAFIAERPLSSTFHLHTGIHLAQAGYQTKDKVVFGNVVGRVKATLLYVQVPLLLRFEAVKIFKTMKLSVLGGPYVAYALSGDVADQEIEFDGDLKRFDFGASGGLQVALGRHLFADARYNLGLADISDVKGLEASANNQIFTFGLGYMF